MSSNSKASKSTLRRERIEDERVHPEIDDQIFGTCGVLPPAANFAGDRIIVGNTVDRSRSRLVAIIIVARCLVARHRYWCWYVSDSRIGRHRRTRNIIRISRGRLIPVRQGFVVQNG
jgi:hypothetical protein